MGVLIDGKWTDGELPQETTTSGQFKRVDSSFRDRITADGSSGFKAEPGRYHLYVAHGCPWAHRTLIYRALKKLDGPITVAYSIPGLKQQGWQYGGRPALSRLHSRQASTASEYLHQAYTASKPDYTGKVTVPTLWDKKTKRIVNNESSEIIRMLNTEFNAITGDRTDYYPEKLRAEIDAVNERVYHNVNNGVYRAGFAKSQAAYEEAYDGLFSTLDWLEERLSKHRYLVGLADHRGRLAAVPHAGSLRRRLFLDLQVQPPAHRRLSEPVELHARALSGAGRRRDRHAALLRDQLLLDPQGEPDADHPEGHAGRISGQPHDRRGSRLSRH